VRLLTTDRRAGQIFSCCRQAAAALAGHAPRTARTGPLLGVFPGRVLPALITTVTPTSADGKFASGVQCKAACECDSGDCSYGVCPRDR
jgi:hypothetical protein